MLCPRCGSEIQADDVNLANLVAKCRQCNEVFNFAGQVDEPAGKQPAAKHTERVPQPPGVWIEDDGDRRRIVRRWFTWVIVFLVFFCIAWDGFLVFWYSMVLEGDAPWIMAVFPIIHLAVGVGLTYFTLAGLFNRTVVEVANGRLLVRHGPVPWPGNRDLDPLEVRQIYCTDAVNTGRYGQIYHRYVVNALLADQRTVPLLTGLDDRITALFYKQQLEGWLRLKPEHVPGAVEA
jgi:hypothetical protein